MTGIEIAILCAIAKSVVMSLGVILLCQGDRDAAY